MLQSGLKLHRKSDHLQPGVWLQYHPPLNLHLKPVRTSFIRFYSVFSVFSHCLSTATATSTSTRSQTKHLQLCQHAKPVDMVPACLCLQVPPLRYKPNIHLLSSPSLHLQPLTASCIPSLGNQPQLPASATAVSITEKKYKWEMDK